MKSRLIFALLAIVAVFSIGFMSCKKDTVVQDNGDPHNNGYSEVISVKPNDWVAFGSGSGKVYTYSYYLDIALPWGPFSYGTDIALLYINASDPLTGTGGQEYPLMGNGTVLGDYSFYYGVSYDANKYAKVTVTAAPISSNATTAPNSTLYIHAVYIQPFTQSSSSTKVDLNDYNAVKKAYNLKN